MRFGKTLRSVTATGAALALLGLGAGAANAATIDDTEDVSLTIHKYAGSPTGQLSNGNEVTVTDRDPLAGVTFQVCQVDGLNVNTPADWADITALNTAINADAKHALPAGTTTSGCTSKVTNDQGIADWTDLDQGVYYVTETNAPANVAERALPFLVTLPLSATDGSWIYDVHVYPKNAITSIEKEAVEMGPLGVGSAVDWKVTSAVANTQGVLEDYRLFDHLDPRLSYDQAADATVISLNGTALDAADYTVAVTTPDDQELVTVTFTATGLAKLEAAKTTAGAEITWEFSTIVKSVGDGVIENSASVLVNNPGGSWEDGNPSEPVEQTFGNLTLNKIDAAGKKPLTGAVFQVFGTQAQADACVTQVEAAKGTLPAGCTGAITIYRDADGNALPAPGQDKFTTAGTDGNVTIPGLYVGTDEGPTSRDYYVVEIVPPTGYINANDVYTATITAGGVTDAGMNIENGQVPPTTLPETGAKIAKIMIVAAIALGGGAFAIAAANRRKEKTNV